MLHSLLVFVVSEEKPIVIQIDIALYAISWDSLANLLFDFHFKQFYYGVSMHCSLALSCLEFAVHLETVNLYISPNLRSFGAISFSSSFFSCPIIILLHPTPMTYVSNLLISFHRLPRLSSFCEMFCISFQLDSLYGSLFKFTDSCHVYFVTKPMSEFQILKFSILKFHFGPFHGFYFSMLILYLFIYFSIFLDFTEHSSSS